MTAKDVFVPEHRTTALKSLVGGEHVGSAKNKGPLFRMPFLAIGSYILGGVALGCAEGAYRGYVEAARRRRTTYTGIPAGGFQAVQIKVAEAAVRIEAAGLMMREDCRQASAAAAAGRAPDLGDKLRWRRNAAWTVRQCVEAVDLLQALSGAGGLYTTNEMPRFFRDMHAISAHIIYSFDVQATMFGSHELGIPGPPPVL